MCPTLTPAEDSHDRCRRDAPLFCNVCISLAVQNCIYNQLISCSYQRFSLFLSSCSTLFELLDLNREIDYLSLSFEDL